ncbi:hypothetical protein EDB86DRAFT_2940493 [Lactarius hatsudake]|nr:hypothetical protein EDB86DRAFT_2940493 [Lactarius hatsudake]
MLVSWVFPFPDLLPLAYGSLCSHSYVIRSVSLGPRHCRIPCPFRQHRTSFPSPTYATPTPHLSPSPFYLFILAVAAPRIVSSP